MEILEGLTFSRVGPRRFITPRRDRTIEPNTSPQVAASHYHPLETSIAGAWSK